VRQLDRSFGLTPPFRFRSKLGRGFLDGFSLARRGLGFLGLDRGAPDLVGCGFGGADGPLRSARAPIDLGFRGALRPLFLGDQRLPVGDRNLIIVRMNFAEGEEAVAVAAVIDERRLERRLDPGHLGEIDVALQLSARGRLEIEFLDAIAAHDDHPSLLRVRRVDEHLVGH
jgi:hypothetical protein